MTTALDRLITKYRSGVGVTPLETCILEQTLKPGELATEAAAELSLMKMALETQHEISEMYRKEIKKQAENQVVLWRSFISTLDDQETDWRASQQSLAVSLLERFDEWVIERKKP